MNRKFAILALVTFCALVAACKKAVPPGPDVWAVVNGKEIGRVEVEKYYRTKVNDEGPAPSQEESLSLKLSILDELINNEILLERAFEEPFEKSADTAIGLARRHFEQGVPRVGRREGIDRAGNMGQCQVERGAAGSRSSSS